MENKVYGVVEGLIQKLQSTQEENVEKTARLFADALKNGGMLQAFGSGHSQAGASELCFRAGGFIPTKQIKEPAGGAYEGIEGVGTSFMKKVDVRPNDVIVLISNSGRNPLPVEIALAAHEKGAKVVAITSLEASKHLTPKHSCGKNLWQLADVVIDNCVMDGDASIDVEGLDTRICGMSAITTAILIQACVYRTAQMLLEEGIVPPVFKSQNIDGGPEYNDRLLAQYFDRMYHM
ncbi:sugar isomerase domain-containing protein [Holdemania massiliensis]|uniref:sugar isomerase domain-containing protein n=1 Tax=Holdemania massiliensis TaxID=1468449 RepID=UPI003522187B